MVAATDRAELDGGDACVEEGDGVGGAVAAHGDALPHLGATRATASASVVTYGSSRETIAGARWKILTTSQSGSSDTAARISSGSCPGR